MIFRFAFIILLLTLLITIFLAAIFSLDILLAWLVAVNIVTLLVYGYDKAIAGGRNTRVPEKVLLALALLGGTPAAFMGMQIFRHKTAKTAFQAKFWLIAGVQLVLGLIYWLQIRSS